MKYTDKDNKSREEKHRVRNSIEVSIELEWLGSVMRGGSDVHSSQAKLCQVSKPLVTSSVKNSV